MNDFCNFGNYRSPMFFDLIHIVHVWGSLNLIDKSSLRLTMVHSVTTSGLLLPSWNVPVIDWATSGLLPPRMIESGIDCSCLAQLEYVQKTHQRVSIIALI